MRNKKFYFNKDDDFIHCNLIIAINDESVASFNISAKDLNDDFIFEGISYGINITLTDTEIVITIDTELEDNDIDNFDLRIECNQENEHNININLYVPTAPFTNMLSSALFELADNNKIIPMIDVENKSKFNHYLQDELIDFKHFLDLSSMKTNINEKARVKAKELRKLERKQKNSTSINIPEAIEEPMKLQDIINEFINIKKNKDKVIPVFLWNGEVSLGELKKFYLDLSAIGYSEFAIRLLDYNGFIQNIKEIREMHDFIILADLNTNFNIDYIKQYLKSLIDNFKNIVYLGAHFLPTQMTISRNDANINNIMDNIPIMLYKELIKAYPSLHYGDYCGFDRKTLSSMPKWGTPTARVILESLDDSAKILIRRGWDNKDILHSSQSEKETIGVINSMTKLLRDIQNGKIDKAEEVVFMDTSLCDADKALKAYYPDRTSPGEIKTLCIRHNIFSVKHNYIKN